MTMLAYIRNPLLRHSAERDPAALARHAEDPRAAAVLIAGEYPDPQGGPTGHRVARFERPGACDATS